MQRPTNDQPAPPPVSPPEESVSDSTARLRAVINTAVDGIITIDERGVIDSVNPAAVRIFGYEAEEVVGRNISMLMPEPYQREHDGYLANYRETGERKIIGIGREVQGRRKDGSVFPIDLAVSETHLGDRRIFTGIVRDITERVAVEESLRQSEQKFRALADNIAQLAWMADATGWITWYNERWFEFTGTTLSEMEGWGWRKIHHRDHVDRVTEKFKRHLTEGEVWEDTFPLRRADGEYRWFLSRAVPIRDEQGRVTRWFGTNTDITERMAMEEALKDADRRKDAFLAMLGHELRNPLATIVHGIHLLAEGETSTDQRSTVTRLVREQAGHMSRLVDDLLDVSRISRGKITLRTECVDLAEIIHSCVRDHEMTDSMGTTGPTRTACRTPSEPVWVEGDRTRLTQIVVNLLSNARKFTDDHAAISVDLAVSGDRAELRVSDRGIGMSAKTLATIFEPFVQADEADKGGRGGLGLGLALVKGLAELHRGEVIATSEGLGRGSTLTVRLPLAVGAEAGDPPDAGAAPAKATGLRILLVEDSDFVAMTLCMVLEQIGHTVRVATNGDDALAEIDRDPPQVVISDIAMPGMDGYELARRVRNTPAGRDMALVATSGFSQPSDIERATEAGFDEYLTKPADLNQIRELLNKVAARVSS